MTAVAAPELIPVASISAIPVYVLMVRLDLCRHARRVTPICRAPTIPIGVSALKRYRDTIPEWLDESTRIDRFGRLLTRWRNADPAVTCQAARRLRRP